MNKSCSCLWEKYHREANSKVKGSEGRACLDAQSRTGKEGNTAGIHEAESERYQEARCVSSYNPL